MPLQISISNSIGGGGGSQGGAPTPSYSNEYSFLFDGIVDYIDCGTLTAYDTGDFSCSLWVYKTTSNDIERIISNSGSSSKAGFDIVMDKYENINVSRNTRTADASSGYTAIGFTINTWHHVVATYKDSTKTLKIYLDGVLKDTTIGTTSTNSSSTRLMIGSYNGVSAFFTGNIDEVGIFDTELIASDVTSIFNSGVPASLTSYSPVGWWRMGEEASYTGGQWTLTDQGSGGNNGTSATLPAPPTQPSTDVPLWNNKSFVFDGSLDYVDMGDVLDMANDGTDAYSISAWIKTTSTATYQIIVAKQKNVANYNGYNFYIKSGTRLQFSLGTVAGSAYIQGRTNTLGALNNGSWHHVVLTYDGSQDVSGFSIYVDGVSYSVVTILNNTPNDVSNAQDFLIGARGIGGSPALCFDGNIDEVSYFDGELTSGNITTIYNSGVPNDISALNPVGWWRMGEDATFDGTNWTLPDNGSGGNDGDSVSMPLASRTSDVPT